MNNRFRPKEFNYKDLKETSLTQYLYIDYNLIEDETLHTISMKFGISIADLKRINNLQNDRDIYALKFLKIPIKPNSYYSEKYASQLKIADYPITRLNSNNLLSINLETNSLESEDDKSSEDLNQANNPNDKEECENATTNEADSTSLNIPLLNELGFDNEQSAKHSNQTKKAKKYLKKFDHKIESLKNHNDQLLNSVQDQNLIQVPNATYYREKSSDLKTKGVFNLSSRDILIIAVVIVVLLPLSIFFYRILYLKEHHLIP